MNFRVITLVLALATGAATLAACGGGDDSSADPTVTSIAATATVPDADAESGAAPASTGPPEATAAPSPTEASEPADPSPAAPTDACAALPSLEEISAVMGTDMSTATPLERGPASDLCEAGGAADGGTYVQFSRTPDTTREQTEALAEELGYPVTDLGDPALAGGFTYASAAAVNIDGTEYLVQAIGLDTLGDPNSPVATARSAQLLVLWLANLGVTPIS